MSGALTDTSIVAGASGAGAYTIDQSLRFNDGDSAYLSRTPGSVGNRKTWTVSCWVKRTSPGVSGYFFGATNSGVDALGIAAADNLQISVNSGSDGDLGSTAKYRDPGAWYHIVVAFDTTQSVAANRVKAYVNGNQVTDWATETYPIEDYETGVNNTASQTVGSYPSGGYFDGYVAEAYLIDGQALTPSDFAETDVPTNQWIPKKYVGTYGTNGFYQAYGSTDLATAIADAGSSSHSFVSQTGGLANTLAHRSRHGQYEWTAPEGVSSIEILVVAGGGGTGGSAGGGGGGGVCYNATHSVTAGNTYRIQVGQGGGQAWGTGHGGNYPNGGIGQDSTFSGTGTSTITALGGGAGIYGAGDWTNALGIGGSGGGGGRSDASAPGGAGNQADSGGATGYGNDGGNNSTSSPYNGGGGGGANAEGADAGTGAGGGVGGAGKAFTIADGTTSVTYAGGGGGAGTGASAAGGAGGGGSGSDNGTTQAGNGTDGLGGGAGGGGTSGGAFKNGGKGGDGIVIIYDGTTRTSFEVADTSLGDSSISFNGTDQKITIADSADWNFGTGNFTIEFWMKIPRSNQTYTGSLVFLDHLYSTSMGWKVSLEPYNEGNFYRRYLHFRSYSGTDLQTTMLPSSDVWRHVAIVREGTGTDETKIYIDGVENVSTTCAEDFSVSAILDIGGLNASVDWLIGYQTEIRISNTARYTANFMPQLTRFVSDANTKLLIHSNWNGGFGQDGSGLGNNYTPTNLVVTDQVPDSPTNNFCTLNPLIKPQNAVAYSEGNLQSLSTGAWNGVVGTVGVSSGKWYWEQVVVTQYYSEHGIVGDNATKWFDAGANPQTGTGHILYGYNGKKNIDNTETNYGDTFTSDDIIGVALNMDDSQVTFYKNNTAQDSGTPISFSGTIVNAKLIMPCSNQTGGGGNPANEYHLNAGQDSSFGGAKTAQGNSDGNGVGDFYYTPPAGYLALCTSNLSDPSISLPESHFNTVLYSGTGASNAITGVGFQPDLIWLKTRESGDHWLSDVIQTFDSGGSPGIRSNTTGEQFTYAGYGVSAVGSDGFTVIGNGGLSNGSTNTYAAWNWKAGGTGVANTDGSINSTVSANTTSGFSIVKFTGTGANATVGHGLSEAPDMVIVKRLESADNWAVGSNDMNNWQAYMHLDESSAQSGSGAGGYWNDTAPTASVFSVGTSGETNYSEDMISYCFHSVEGYSKVGLYEGNGNADGTFVYTGFRPSWLLLKSVDGSAHWEMEDDKRDPYNLSYLSLQANLNNAEDTSTSRNGLDMVSNGFKFRSNQSNVMNGSETYMYLAYAEFPFKYSNAR